jgi:hypothetical protein
VLGSSFLASLVIGFIASLAIGHGGPQPRPAPSVGTRQGSRNVPMGEWIATGHVLTATNVSGRHVGEVLKRRWRFERECSGGDCQDYFLRTSSTGVQRSPLRTRKSNYLAEFGYIGSDCEVRPGYFASFAATFSIWWTKDRSRLVAEETGGFRDARCGYAGERIRWTARRVGAGPSEGSRQVL